MKNKIFHTHIMNNTQDVYAAPVSEPVAAETSAALCTSTSRPSGSLSDLSGGTIYSEDFN